MKSKSVLLASIPLTGIGTYLLWSRRRHLERKAIALMEHSLPFPLSIAFVRRAALRLIDSSEFREALHRAESFVERAAKPKDAKAS